MMIGRMGLVVGVLGGMAVAAAASPDTAEAQESASDISRIRAFLADWETAFNSGDLDRMRGYWTDDVVVIPQGAPAVEGLDAFWSTLQQQVQLFFAQFDVEYRLVIDEVAVSGDMAYDRGTIHMSLTPRAGGPTQTASRRYLEILRKQPDGAWRISRAMNNESPRPPAPEVPASIPRGSGTWTGTWQGELNAGGTPVRIVVQLEETPAGLSSTITVVEQGTTRSFDRATARQGRLSLELDASNLVIEGTLDAAGDLIHGQWIQRGVTLPLELRRR